MFSAGTRVAVRVSEFNTETKKLTLTMKFSSQDVSAVAKISHEKYFQAAVQKVLSYGLIVRPAGIDVSGLVHVSQIPRSLVTALKKRITVEAGQNKSDVELVFQEGDVMKVRIQSVDVDTNKVEFSLQQYRANEEDEDDYVVEGRETEEELEEAEKNGRDDQDEDLVPYDAEELLLWWRGAAYVKSDASEAAKVDEDLEVIMESTAIVEGTWRRLFEIDLRADEADYSAKAVELDLKEIEEEIGELGGLDDDVTSDPIGFGVGGDKGPRSRAGSFIALSSLPEEWKSQISFLKELETEEQTILKGLKSGKKGESSELASLIAKVEAEAVNAASARSSRRPREEVFAAPAEPAAPAQE